ncbi:MAG TPA: hypothetical protein VK982_02520, partial [Bacteroidales bacterium]|nr:hypothetical protein [Bacteroidales bacterium]
LLHIVDISHPNFEEQIQVVDETLQEIGTADSIKYLVFNKIDAYTFEKKDEDDLTPKTKENLSLEDLQNTWFAKNHDSCIFISAKNKTNINELKKMLYDKVKEIHVQRYPYDNFLY